MAGQTSRTRVAGRLIGEERHPRTRNLKTVVTVVSTGENYAGKFTLVSLDNVYQIHSLKYAVIVDY